MALSGRPGAPPLGPPTRLVDGVLTVGERLAAASAEVGERVELDWLALLGERAALSGLQRRGTTSCGGATRLLPTADGWLAVSLARADDHDLLPAWVGVVPTAPREVPWTAVAAAVAARPTAALLDGAALLGLPAGGLGEWVDRGDGGVRTTEVASGPPTPALAAVRVLDLTGLWAGPLCTSLLARAGASVVKVESTARPDGARRGDPAFFDLLNAGKQSVALDLRAPAGRAALARLVGAADVVVESSRPRAMEQLGIVAAEVLAAPTGPRVWASITGHGRASARVAFGDDAAVAGGLVVRDEVGPCFCADAVADPASGVTAAAVVLEALARGGRCIVDVALAGVAAGLAGPTLPAEGEPAPPRARTAAGRARPLGTDTEHVLAAW
jgi:hypothetical protein